MNDDTEELIEEVVSAFRERSPTGQIRVSPAWRDLSPDNRMVAAKEAQLQRALEANLDPSGYSGTVRAVLARIIDIQDQLEDADE